MTNYQLVTSSPERVKRAQRQSSLGRKLRILYDEIAQEPCPDEFLMLLEEADKAEKQMAQKPENETSP